ncbi:NAD-dependent epimerase/dehydratase family protein [Pedobacter alluvionis]|uniref:NAD-dependent epimerase/dehydratase family protein n=1 Tax=Pedobacter alluvionis TaxID=475253 RepID=A0A497YC01_9SPHI|nr:NAD-dependent epimerase/dehydratase family protein [Pedobacter alluvionis]RLJ80208.1 nucleoside-diphosphate-sugar epimerase [Pedobacter alluvionis]TFB31492.1 NAD-dependent epimerase/dehydratase family protein [Pedobacter alluvionis]
MKQTILGAGGAIGIELAKALAQYTSDIRLVSRNPEKVNQTDNLFPADLSKREEVFKAVQDSKITYVAIGFPYKASVWKENWPSFIQNVVDACLEYNSKLVFFDNVYAIGGNNVNHITESSPISPTSKKGEVRAEVDRIILENMEKNKLQALIARSPDFFGGTARQTSVMMNLVYDNLIKDKKAQWFCNAKHCHSMGYVPELAKGTAMLGNTDEAYNQIWNLPTSPKRITGEEWINLFAKELGKENKFSVLPNWLVKGLGLFVPVMKELAEMNYQYDRDYFFDSSKFNNYFNFTPITHAVAVKQAIAQMNDINNKTTTR